MRELNVELKAVSAGELVNDEPVKPIIYVHGRYTTRYCGACANKIGVNTERCGRCGTPVDWKGYWKGNLQDNPKRKERRAYVGE